MAELTPQEQSVNLERLFDLIDDSLIESNFCFKELDGLI